MTRKIPGYPLTLFGLLVLTLSFGVFLLSVAEAVPPHGVWRALVIPAWLTLTASAILRTALPAAAGVPHVVFMLVGMAVCLLPLFIVDWLVGRRRAT